MRDSNFKLQRIRVPGSKTKSTAVHVTAFARRCSNCSVIFGMLQSGATCTCAGGREVLVTDRPSVCYQRSVMTTVWLSARTPVSLAVRGVLGSVFTHSALCCHHTNASASCQTDQSRRCIVPTVCHQGWAIHCTFRAGSQEDQVPAENGGGC